MSLAGTKLRSWRRRLDTACRNVGMLRDEIEASGDEQLAKRMAAAEIDLGNCLSMLGAMIEVCRDSRGKRPEREPR